MALCVASGLTLPLYPQSGQFTRLNITVTGAGSRGYVNFGAINVGQSSAPHSLGFSFSASTQVARVAVLMQGASGKDFLAASGGTCAAGTYSSGSSCTVKITFHPLAPGMRNGAVVLYDAAAPANALITVYLTGTGVGPAIGFGPGIIGTVAGNGTSGYSGDGGLATGAELNRPWGVALDGAGNLFIADVNNSRVRKVDSGGTITTVAGNGTYGYSGDSGPATSAQLNNPIGLAVNGAGNLYIGDEGNQRIRKVDPAGTITTVAGNGTTGFVGDGGPATSAGLYDPTFVVVDGAGNLYIAEQEGHRIRKVDSGGTITTVAGDGTTGFGGDGGPATSAQLQLCRGLAVDGAGNLYIAEELVGRGVTTGDVRKVDPAGTITTVAGNRNQGSDGDGGPATSAAVSANGVAVDGAGDLYITDGTRVRKVDPAGTITTVAGDGTYGYSGDGGPATAAEMASGGIALDGAGNLYVSDYDFQRIRKVDVSVPPSLRFPDTVPGNASAAQDIILENLGNAVLDIAQISAPADYTLSGAETSCASKDVQLGPGFGCTLGIKFAPRSTGAKSGDVTLTDNHLNSTAAVQTIPLTGNGMGGAPSFATLPSPQVEATGPAGAVVTFDVTASNGDGASRVVCNPASGSMFPLGSKLVTCTATDPLNASLSNTASFNVAVRDTTPPTLQLPGNMVANATNGKGAVVAYTVKAADLVDSKPAVSCKPASGSTFPVGTTTVSCSATDFSSNVTTGSFSIQVMGGRVVMVRPAAIDFGPVYLGSVVTKNVTVTSSGTQPVTISTAFISQLLGRDSKAFAAVNLCPKSLATGKSCIINVVFAAGPAYTQQTALLNVVDNALNSPQTVSLSAKVINPQAALSTRSLSFERRRVNTRSAVKTITLQNSGTTALTINSIAIAGANPLDFVQSSNCPISLDPNRRCAVNVVFKPMAKGPRSATVVIADNTRNGSQTVLLSGAGN